MKKTYNKVMVRGIKGTLNRFLSVFAIVALGAGFLAGLLSTSPDMKFTADKYFDEHNSYDINIKSTLGITEDDVTEIRTQNGVLSAAAAYVTDSVAHDKEGETYTARIFGTDFSALENNNKNYINKITLTEGRFPENENECVIEVPNQYTMTLSVGDTMTIVPSGSDITEDDLYDTYNVLEYTVVGIAQSPMFISMSGEPSRTGSGKISVAMYVPEECYSLDVYTDIFVIINGATELQMFSDEYKNLADDTISSLESFGEERGKIRYDSIIGEATDKLNDAKQELEDEKASAQKKLDDAREELDNAQKEIDDGKIKIAEAEIEIADKEKEIADAEIELTDAEIEIADKEAEIADGYAQIAEAETEIAANEADLIRGEAQLNEAEQTLNDSQAQLDAVADQIAAAKAMLSGGFELSDEIKAQIELYDMSVAQVEAGRVDLNANRAEIQNARRLLNDGKAEIERNRRELEDGETQINEAKAEIEENKQELADGKIKLEDGKKELEEKKLELIDGEQKLADAEIEYSDALNEYNEKIADAEQKIKDAEKDIKNIEKGEWIFFSREEGNSGFSKYDDDISKVAAISKVFPVFFFLVAALVALTTMTRMIDEDRPRIGALKSLGYKDGTILFYYCIYSGAASVLGSLFGIILGMKILPLVISSAYRMMYATPLTETPIGMNMGIAVFVAVAIISVIELTTVSACHGLLKERPAALLTPKAPPSGKRILLERITPLWKRLSFTHKVTARNLFRYKKRFMMTIIGVAGCSALLVTGFGIRDSISDIVDKQYNEIYNYDISLSIKNENVIETDNAVAEYLSDNSQVARWMLMHSEDAEMKKTGSGGDTKAVTLYVPKNPSELENSITLRDRKTKKRVEFGEDSVVITEKFADALGVSVGDSVDITNKDGDTVSFEVTGIAENYVSAFIYMSPKLYDKYVAIHRSDEPEYLNVMIKAAEGALKTEEERDAVTSKLLDSDGVVYCLHSETVKKSFSDSVKSIDYIVIVLIVCAGALAVIVLYNLININICERRKELATIKVLGFFDSEVSSYIFRETNLLSAIGCAVGLVGGIFLHMFVIRTVEVDAVMFGKSIYPLSYVYAAVITVVFTIVVDLLMLKHLKNIDMVESMKAND